MKQPRDLCRHFANIMAMIRHVLQRKDARTSPRYHGKHISVSNTAGNIVHVTVESVYAFCNQHNLWRK